MPNIHFINEHKDRFKTTFTAVGFSEEKHADHWLHDWQLWNMGYSAMGRVVKADDDSEGAYKVECQMFNSCD